MYSWKIYCQYEGNYSDYLIAYERNHPGETETPEKPGKQNKNSSGQAVSVPGSVRPPREKKLKFTFKEQREFEINRIDI